MMQNSEYWKLRFEQLEEAQNRLARMSFKDLEAQYRAAQRELEGKINIWYQRIAKNNSISMAEARKLLSANELEEFKWTLSDYIKHGQESALNGQWIKQLENASAKFHISKYQAMMIDTRQSFELMFGKQLDTVTGAMGTIYENGYYRTAFELQKGVGICFDVGKVNREETEKVLSKPWAVDGKNFSERIWGNKEKLINEVHNELTQNIITGADPQKAIDAIAKKMNTSKSNAGRLVMTEEAYFSSAAQKNCFEELGVEQFEIVATLDSHTSDICRSLDGKVFDMKDYEPGVTAPPFHVFCRSTTAPYFDEDFGNIGERAARDEETGKTYYIPDDMNYQDWKETFVDGGDKSGFDVVDDGSTLHYKHHKKSDLKNSDESGIIRTQKEAIFNKNKRFLNDAQQKELQTILDGMDNEQLTLYDKLSENFANNEYHFDGGAAYYPWERKVKMNIDANSWDKAIDTDYTGAWNTKFHEEFHQLDHILALNKTDFAKTANGVFADKFTSISTAYGKRMIQAIDDDILSAINKAVDWRNAERVADGMEATFKHLRNLDRISGDASDSLVYWLKSNYGTSKRKAQIDLFTDAVGLSTKNRIPLYSKGFWGHTPSYNKERGKSGATSETWATFAALFNCGDADTLNVIQELMPSTWATYSDIMKEVLEYAVDNTLTYPK